MSDHEPDDGEELELVMPFVCVASAGGPFDDKAFVAGFQAGQLDAELRAPALLATTVVVFEELEQQADLFAMRAGFTLFVVGRAPGFVHLGFTKTPAP